MADAAVSVKGGMFAEHLRAFPDGEIHSGNPADIEQDGPACNREGNGWIVTYQP